MSNFFYALGARPAAILVAFAWLSACGIVKAQTGPDLALPATLSAPMPRGAAYLELPIRRLKQAIPELRGIRYESNQEPLTAVLSGVAERIDDMLPRLPDLISHEEVFHPQGVPRPVSAGGLAPSQPWSSGFNYLLLCRRNTDGRTRINELRTDGKGRLVNAEGLFETVKGFGFAYQWLFFSAANQPEFRFSYLGQQKRDGRNTWVVAFEQDPAKVTEPAYFLVSGKLEPFYYQGVLWVDQTSFDIVALRTDLLEPLPALHLRQLTTELAFRSVPIRGYNAVFWLPSEVDISTDQGAGPVEENHRYSDYHLFHAEARILSSP